MKKSKCSDWADIENLLCKWPLGSIYYFIIFFDWLLKKLTLLSKFTSKQEFLAIVSLGRVCGILPTLVLNTSGVALSRYIGPKWRHLFFILFLISTTVFRFTLIVTKCKELIKILLSHRRELSLRWPPAILFIHEIFSLDARAVKRLRGCVADFILVDVYSRTWG